MAKTKKLRLLLFLLTTILLGCQVEEEFVYEENSKKLEVTLKSFQEFQNQTKLVENVVQINQNLNRILNKNVASRTIDSVDLSNVDYSKALYIEDEQGNHSYTFNIDNTDFSVTENLVLSSKENQEYDAYIFSYNLTESEKLALQDGTFIDLTNKADIIEIDNDLNQTESTSSCWQMVEVEEIQPCAIDGCWDPAYTTVHMSYTWVYTCGGGGGSSAGSGSSGSGTSGGGGIVNTSLLLQANTPCGSLKLKSADNDCKAKIQELKQKATTQNFESGYVTFKNEPKFSQEYQGDPNDEAGSAIDIPLDLTRTDQNGLIHCHLDASSKRNFAVFSLSDLIGFSQLIETSTANNCTLMVTSAKGTFALVVTNKTAFKNMVNEIKPFQNTYEHMLKDFLYKPQRISNKTN
ncbi:MAG: hypothetical protein RBR78_11720 [Flavobacteriaceae bacterium]|jgi:hypothetical protein|nr:hypothetical protein [Flavobacteriaceae bacterium]